MSLALFDGIDWQRPWFTPYRSLGEQIAQSQDWRAALNECAAGMGLANHRNLPIRFVPQASLPAGTAYEAFISATGGVPTRDNLHDFFNALVWLTFSRIKIQLNALQAAEIAGAPNVPATGDSHGVRRGKVRDAATIFDENAAVLVVRDSTWIEALRAHRWSELFVARRTQFESCCQVHLFGHALMEKLITPYKAVTAHVWPVVADAHYFAMSSQERLGWIDVVVSEQLKNGLTTSDFAPLPILGVPHWSPGQDETFYADSAVFRPKRVPADRSC